MGNYVFAGFQTDTAPFDLDITTLTVTYQGDAGAIIREVEPGHRLQINVTGDALEPVLNELGDLVEALRSGDVTAVAPYIDLLEEALDQVTSQSNGVGLATRRIQGVAERLANTQVEAQGLVSRLEDTDMAKAAIELSSREQSYQATLIALSRGNQPTLMDFLG
jgi:flagellar hook-associated protein 3 FlgL